MSGRICLVTGASSGIGEATAAGLARMGATVVMVARDQARGATAQADVRRGVVGGRKDDVDLILADLASLDSVRQLALGFSARYQQLRVLVNNAGVILGSRTLTGDGFETTFEVNYLSHFLLTNLLIETLKGGAPSRIINVSSGAHTRGHIDFDDLQGAKKRYSAMGSYAQSKLAQVLFTYELARRLQGTGVTANCVHPGVVATNWGRRSAGTLSPFLRIFGPLMMSPEKGADTVVYLASSKDVAGVKEGNFTKRKEKESSRESHDEASAKRLWEVSAALTAPPTGH